jgi:peptidoglycan-N-acetylglucosamine deacetylase
MHLRLKPALAMAPVLSCLLLLTGCPAEERPGEPPDAREPPPVPESPAFEGRMAITIDDLPWIGPVHPGETIPEATDRMMDALIRHGVLAAGFVNCDRVHRDHPVLQRWQAAGMELHNHTAGHLDLNRAPLDRWLEEARSCDRFLREVTGEPFVHFRYPYLHQGSTPERRNLALALLEELDSPIAHVSIDTSDWILAASYGQAIRAGDAELQAAIGEAFVEHVLRATRHYQEVAREKVGRDVSHVLLLHANTLVADYLDALLERLRADGFELVSLEEAQRDPVYDLPDDYVGPRGLSWLYRLRPATPEMVAWDDAEAARLEAEFPR